MADFKIQRGTASLSGSSVTLTAGTDYDAPASASSAFVIITNAVKMSGGVDGATTTTAQNYGAYVSDSAAITSSITFARIGTTGTATISYEIWEYTGASGGANEFIVRDVEVISITNPNTTVNGSVVSGVVSDSDVVVFITGQLASSSNVTGGYAGLFSAAWDSANDYTTLTRIGAVSPAYASVAVVEFTGSNWAIQRTADHTMSAAGSWEYETITTVGSTAKTFIHPQWRSGNINLDELAMRVQLTSTTQVGFQLISGATVNHAGCAWIIENTQSSGTVMNVSRYSATWTGGSTTNPATLDVTLSGSVTLATTSMGGMSGYSAGTGTAVPRALVNHRIKDANTVELRKCEDGQDWTYDFEVVEWPEAAAGGGASVALTGQAITSNIGTLSQVTGAIVSLSGQALTSSIGAFTPTGGATVNLSSQALTSTIGTLTALGNASITLTGQSISGNLGTLEVTAGNDVVVALTGQAVTGSLGALSIATGASVSLTGQQIAASLGTLAAGNDVVIALAGMGITGSLGIFDVTGGASVTISGQTLTGALGTLSITVPASGVEIDVPAARIYTIEHESRIYLVIDQRVYTIN